MRRTCGTSATAWRRRCGPCRWTPTPSTSSSLAADDTADVTPVNDRVPSATRKYRRGMDVVTTIEQLESLYGEPVPTSITKEVEGLTLAHRAYVEASPFVVVATSGPGGLDCSP